MSRNYCPQLSSVKVTFADGEVRTYTMSAGAGIAHHLMREARDTGALVMRDDANKKAICIPMRSIRDIEITTLPDAVVIEGDAQIDSAGAYSQ
jgi:hypothetical protein